MGLWSLHFLAILNGYCRNPKLNPFNYLPYNFIRRGSSVLISSRPATGFGALLKVWAHRGLIQWVKRVVALPMIPAVMFQFSFNVPSDLIDQTITFHPS